MSRPYTPMPYTPPDVQYFGPPKSIIAVNDGYVLELESGYLKATLDIKASNQMLEKGPSEMQPSGQVIGTAFFRVTDTGPCCRFAVGEFVLVTPKSVNGASFGIAGDIVVHQDEVAGRVRKKEDAAKGDEALEEERKRAEDALWDGQP